MHPKSSDGPRTSSARAIPARLDLTPEDEQALRREQLALLAELDRVCSAHGLRYFAIYGTLLGAVRHQGFIPWDDDLDVGMLRDDFDRLGRVAADAFGDRFFLQTVDSDPHYGCFFAKLRSTDTVCVDRISHGSRQRDGVFIDIFPLDPKASGPLARRWQKAMRYVGFRFLYLKAGYHFMRGTSPLSRAVQLVARTAIRFVPRRLVIALSMHNTRLGDRDHPAQHVSLFGSYFYDRDTVDAAWVDPLVRLPFEETTIPAFADPDPYLTRIYGDYRTPPPIEHQVGMHEIVELDLSRRP